MDLERVNNSFRIDRVATLHVAQRLRGRPMASGRVPILMYHNVAEIDERGRHPYYRTATHPELFAAQMSYLVDNGYTVINLNELRSQFDNTTASPKPVILTFDDGYRDFYLHAFPTLARHGLTATVYLPTEFIGLSPKQFKGKDCLTWGDVRELAEMGISFGSHTVTHPQLQQLTFSALVEEVDGSKRKIEDELGRNAVDSFAYPFAFPETNALFRDKLRGVLLTAGYKTGVCTNIGRVAQGDDSLFLRRLPVNSCDDLLLFRAKLDGYYDWVSWPQRWKKRAKEWLG